MSVKIRLQRHGKKGKPFFHIVVADARARRDGRLIEKIGTYNPVTNPATIDLDVDAAVKWLNNGAQPTDTARAILSYKGVLYKKHLLGGVAKGAFDEAEADKKFAAWLEEKSKQVEGKKSNLSQSKADAKKAAFDAESKVNQDRLDAAAKIQADAKAEEDAKKAELKAAADAKLAEEKAAEEAANAAVEEEKTEEAPKVEEPAAEDKSVAEIAAENVSEKAAANVDESAANGSDKTEGTEEAKA
ncbi:small subunit ribosomal protein S16 [Halpernia frigidisoli]|uniref:Small ribosomal subunit protein bS16 n=1 Tax=Halpernia frigidisoli TaxID=1125876 RepID=A0A1I3G007_9FLAO|nr:small subunit ribosomal protein S16 [Halpernia frigidisoli]